jgi:hypothetical protein
MLSSVWKSRFNWTLSLTAIAFAIVLLWQFGTAYTVRAEISSGDIISGNETVGTFSIDATEVGAGGYSTTINATIDVEPEAGHVFEGWLVDSNGAIYALSLGNFRDGELQFNQYMTNPLVYDEFLVTQEPLRDIDPDITPPPFGSFSLREPFSE